MKNKQYLQPAMEIIDSKPPRLIEASRGWAKDGHHPTSVVKEDAVSESDKLDDGYGGFLDLD